MEPRSRAMVYLPMTGPLALLLLSGSAARIPHGLRETELRWVERALEQGDAATANQALVGLAVLGEDALPLLPMVLARADRGDLDPDQLADAFEAMGPRAVATLELRAMVAWASHVWVKPGERQRHPYLLPAAMFTPMDLGAASDEIAALSCTLLAEGPRSTKTAILEVLAAVHPPPALIEATAARLRADPSADVRALAHERLCGWRVGDPAPWAARTTPRRPAAKPPCARRCSATQTRRSAAARPRGCWRSPGPGRSPPRRAAP